MKYLFDTNTISYVSERDSPYFHNVYFQLKNTRYSDQVFASILSFYELEHGYACSRSATTKARFHDFTNTVRTMFSIVQLSLPGANVFGELKAQYKAETGITKSAVKRHDIDLMLASTAIAERMVLVSNDKVFETIQQFRGDFKLENWTR